MSCSTVDRTSANVVSLPKLTAEGVTFEDGLEEQEAVILSSQYFHRFVSGCGMPDKPQDNGEYWRVQLWGGYVPTDYGTLQLAKDGSQVLLAPPKRGFKTVTQYMLRGHSVSFE
ncbi:MAG TPA: hypothetical protein VF773_11850 [Verrucomicrobiae bacterium]